MLPDTLLLDWLNQKSETRFVFGLERMFAALDFLKPQTSAICIQVLGTNGKGSSIECLKNILRTHQKNVACYTSPHLFHLYDRFMVNDQAIAHIDFIKHLQKIYTAEKNSAIPTLSYFETTTLLAYLYFCSCDLDFMIIEAGLGGRLDATSALIYSHLMFTSIDYDHQQYLGESLADIAQEKFSVIRSHHQCFSIAQAPEAEHVLLEHINQSKAHLRLENSDFSISKHDHGITFNVSDHSMNNIKLALKGEHQLHNAVLATDLASVLLGSDFNQDLCKHALNQTQKSGRYQHIILNHTTFTLDVAHNQQSFAALMQTSSQEPIDAYCISMLQDKPWKTILKSLITYNKPIYVCLGMSERSWSQDELLSFINDHRHANITMFKSHQLALDHIQQQHQHCLIFGSFFFVGPCIKYLQSSL